MAFVICQQTQNIGTTGATYAVAIFLAVTFARRSVSYHCSGALVSTMRRQRRLQRRKPTMPFLRQWGIQMRTIGNCTIQWQSVSIPTPGTTNLPHVTYAGVTVRGASGAGRSIRGRRILRASVTRGQLHSMRTWRSHQTPTMGILIRGRGRRMMWRTNRTRWRRSRTATWKMPLTKHR